MTLPALQHDTGPNPRTSLIVLHGLGADGHDFVPLCEELDLRALGAVRFIFPHAPEQAVTINGGYVMRAWYDIRQVDLQRQEDADGVRASGAAIAALIDAERARGVPAQRIVLMGFSQGCAMSLFTGLRYPERLGGIVALSGYNPLAEHFEAERSDANRLTPIFMAHGRLDPVVVPARGEAAREQLRALGHTVEWHDYRMEHSVCPEELRDLQAWLLKTLG
ncbi:carboxylesterase [Paucibacter aquatile]|uniref:Carboxylesterase n=2 Tax=Kinneretia aquatilis TaxID=2070761 RepID=A0A2N8L1W2_9BURK|nr:carboxylesterase [Paucibacter aquatile]PND39662.1 carboxylesterase [Paucibacter aquatile]